MKCRNKIIAIWICAIIIVASSWGVILHYNSLQGQAASKEVAVQTLREVAGQVVDLEFEKLKIPYFEQRNEKKHTKRQTVTMEGILEVSIDSLKEEQSLYSLETVGYKANVLNSLNKFPLEQIGREWQKKIRERGRGVVCSLFFLTDSLEQNRVHETFMGDTTICTSQNEIGVYYLDGMYTMILTVYLMPAFWNSIDWTSYWLLSLSCLLLILLLGLPAWIRVQRYKEREIVAALTKDIYQFGKYSFNSAQHTLLYKDEIITDCTPQEANLLLAFATKDLILTNDEIATACGWFLKDKGLDARRRKVISLLRNLFNADDSVKIVALDNKGGYQMIISQ